MPSGLYKYWLLLTVSWQNQFVYRASLLVWRTRNFLSTFIALTVWNVIFDQGGRFLGYTQSDMITFIFLMSILQGFIISTALNGLASQVYSGQITYQLLKPVNLFAYLATDDIADKLKNIFFVCVESVLLFFMFSPSLSFPNIGSITLFILWVLMGTILHFLINLLFGAIGFWSPDVWGPKFLFYMLLEFTSGKMYPLDILPQFIQNIFFLTPFPYLSYVQAQLFIDRLDMNRIVAITGGMIIWIIGLSIVTKRVWIKGLKDYTASGR
jgi:ABC-2 type transport system permease protein